MSSPHFVGIVSIESWWYGFLTVHWVSGYRGGFMAYEHIRHHIRVGDRYLFVDRDGSKTVSLDFDGDLIVSQSLYSTYPSKVVLTVLGTDPRDVREQLEDLTEQVRENFVISAMDELGCGTSDLVVYEFWCTVRGRWLGGGEFLQTTVPLFARDHIIALVAARKVDGLFNIGGFDLNSGTIPASLSGV